MQNKKSEKIGFTFLSSNVEAEGKLVSTGKLQLDCVISGEIHADALDIGQKAQVSGKLYAKKVTVAGKLDGKIFTHSIDIIDTAVVSGKIKTGSINIDHESLVECEIEIAEPVNNELPAPASPKKLTAAIKNIKEA